MEKLRLVRFKSDGYIHTGRISDIHHRLTGRTHAFFSAIKSNKDFCFATQVKSVAIGRPAFYRTIAGDVYAHPDVAIDFIKTMPSDSAKFLLSVFGNFIAGREGGYAKDVIVEKNGREWRTIDQDVSPHTMGFNKRR